MSPKAKAVTTFDVDVLIWGCSLWGDSDPGVLAVERWHESGETPWHRGPLWDSGSDMNGWYVDTGEGFRPAPLSWRLPWVREWVMRQEMAYVQG